MNIEDRFRVKYSSDTDELVTALRDNKPEYGEEIAPGIVLHYNSKNKLVEIKILDTSEFIRTS